MVSNVSTKPAIGGGGQSTTSTTGIYFIAQPLPKQGWKVESILAQFEC